MKFENLPTHIAIIMDGNRRWAFSKGMPKIKGHQAGVDNLKSLLLKIKDLDYLKYLTCYILSTENMDREASEVSYLERILDTYLEKEEQTFIDNDIVLNVIGDYSVFNDSVITKINKLKDITKNNNGIVFTMALNYGGRQDIIQAVNSCLSKKISSVTEDDFQKELYTGSIIDPDLLIRTGKEKRISNFLLWQIKYTEFYFSDTYWPDFTFEEFLSIIENYSKRGKRKGK